MDYSEYQYQNICKKLQNRITVLESFLTSPEIKIFIAEAGMRQALMSGDRAKMEKELARQRYLQKFKEELSNKGVEIGTENFDILDPEVQRLMNPSPETRMARVIARIGVDKEDKEGKKRPTGIQGHRKNMEDLAMQLDSEYPLPGGRRRITVAELPAESPFGSDLEMPPRMHVTPQQY